MSPHTHTRTSPFLSRLYHTHLVVFIYCFDVFYVGVPGCTALLLCHDDTFYDTGRDPPTYHDNSGDTIDTGSGPRRYTFSEAVVKVVETARGCGCVSRDLPPHTHLLLPLTQHTHLSLPPIHDTHTSPLPLSHTHLSLPLTHDTHTYPIPLSHTYISHSYTPHTDIPSNSQVVKTVCTDG